MTLADVILVAFAFAFGDPTQILEAHVRATIGRLTPCREASRAACLRDHRAIAHAVALAAETGAEAVALVGLCAHETACRDVDQVRGPAIGPWQCEAPRELRASLRADMLAQAHWALRAWRHGSRTYACGGGNCERAAAELRSSVVGAWWAWMAASP